MTTPDLDTQNLSGKWQDAMLAPSDPIANYWATFVAYNEGKDISESDFFAAFDELHDYEPITSRDIVRKFVSMFADGGAPETDRQEALINQAKRALEREA